MTPRTPRRPRIAGLWMAQRRAEETHRPRPLFTDPWAEVFVTAAGSAAPPRWASAPWMGDYFAIRTRFFDDHLQDATVAGCRQVVILAAGLDARAFRLPWPPDVTVFELDLPDTLEFKERVLAQRHARPTCARRVPLAVDLRADWAHPLRHAGFDPADLSAWLAEGILMYLTPDEGDRLLATISGLSPAHSRLALEHAQASNNPSSSRAALWLLARLGTAWKAAISDPDEWLARHGWTATVHTPAALAARYGRKIRKSATPGWLIEATRA
jgi:methyltransferase (TIGR00027 family)